MKKVYIYAAILWMLFAFVAVVSGCGSSSHSGGSDTTVQNNLKDEHVGNAQDYEFHRITLDNGQQCIMADQSSDWNIGLSCDWSQSTTTTTTTYTYTP